MPWTDAARREHARRTPRYASDLTDGEWALIAPFMPSPRRVGRPREVELREVVNAILYLVSTGCQWRMLPKDFPRFRRFSATSTAGATAACGARSATR